MASLHLPADPLSFPKNAHQIATKNFSNVVGTVSAIQQRLCNLRQISGGVNPQRSRAAYPVKVRPQSDMIDPGDLGDMVNVIDQRFKRRTRNLRRPLALEAVVIEIRDRFPGDRLHLVVEGLDRGVAVFTLCFRRLAVVLVDKGIVEVDLDHAVVLCDCA